MLHRGIGIAEGMLALVDRERLYERLAEDSVEVDQHVVLRGGDDAEVEGDIGISERVGIERREGRGPGIEMLTQRDEVFVAPALGREPGGLEVESFADVADLVELGALAAESEGLVVGGASGDVGAVTLADLNEADAGEGPDGFPDGASSDAELAHQLRFGGESGANGPFVGGDPGLELCSGGVREGASGDGGHAQTSDDQMSDATRPS